MKQLSKIKSKKAQKNIISLLESDWDNSFEQFLDIMNNEPEKFREILSYKSNREIIEKMLVEKNVPLDGKNYFLYEVCNFELLANKIIEKIKDNFKEGMEFCTEVIPFPIFDAKREIFDKYNNTIFEIGCKNGFVLNENNKDYLEYFPALAMSSLFNDPIRTMEQFPSLYGVKSQILNNKSLVKMGLTVLRRKNIDLNNLPNYDELGIISFLYPYYIKYDIMDVYSTGESAYQFLSPKEKKILFDFDCKKRFETNPSFLPQYIIDDPLFLKETIDNDEDRRLIANITSREPYKEDTEFKLLKKLGTKCRSLEEQIGLMAKENKPVFELSEYELLVVTLYCKKRLNKEGINDYKINEHSYIPDKECGGDCSWVNKTIRYNAFHQAVRFQWYLEVGLHETQHAIQHNNMENRLLDNDPSLLVYSKDDILHRILPQYYKQNYSVQGIEFDAEFKAIYEKTILCNEEEILLKKYTKFGIEELKKNRKYIELMDDRLLGFKDSQIRIFDNKEYNLDDLFLEQVKKYALEGKDIKSLFDKNPILLLEYKLEPEFAKKNIKEMVMDLLNLKEDKRTQTLGLKILEMRLANNKEEYLENKEFLRSVARNKKYPGAFKERIKDIVISVNKIKSH